MYKNLRNLLLSFLVFTMILCFTCISASYASSSDISITTQPSDVTIYAGNTATISVKASGSGTLKYQWYRNTKDQSKDGIKISSATSSSYSISTKTAGTTYYYCLVYTTGTEIASATSETATVVVKALPKITKQPTDTTVYTGSSSSISVKATGSGTLSYQWYSNTRKNTTNASIINSAINDTYTLPATAAGTIYYYCVVTNTDSSITGTKTAAVTSSIAQVIVKEITVKPSITTQPSALTVYTGSTAKMKIAAVGSGTLTYQWYSNSVNSTTGSTAIDGATGTAYTIPTESEGVTYYYCIVTNTITSASETQKYTTTSSIVAGTVKACTQITQQPIDTTAYIGDTATLSVTATGNGTLSYQWYSNTKNTTSGSSKISAATSSSYAPPTKANGTTYYYCIVKSTDSSMANSTGSSVTSNLAKFVVLAESASAPVITVQPSSVSVYIGSIAALTVNATGTGSLTYQWYSNSENSTTTGTIISGATDTKYSPSTSIEGINYYYCIVNNTVTTATGTESMSAASEAASVTIKALPSITAQPSGATLYSGEDVTLSVSATGSGTLSYQWYINTKSNNTSGSKIKGATDSAYTLHTSITGTAYYYCMVTNTDITITEKKIPTVASSIATVIVKAANATAPKITKYPASLTVFTGDEAPLSIEANGSGTLNYQWYCNTKKNTKDAVKITDATDRTYIAPSTEAGIVFYYCVVTNTDSTMPGNQTASTVSNIVSVTVQLLAPTIKQQPASSTVYTGGSLQLAITATGSGTLTYRWYSNSENSNTSGTAIYGATASKYTVPTSEEGTMYYYCVITNTAKKSSGTATGTVVSDVAAVVVKSTPTITSQPKDTIINSGEDFTLTVEASGSNTLAYQWYSNNKNKNSGGKKIKEATEPTFKFTTTASSATTTTYYYCVVTSSGSNISKGKTAIVTSSTATVTIKAVNATAPVITSKLSNQTVTIGNSVTITIESTGSGTLSYQWYRNTKKSTKNATAISGANDKSYIITPTTKGSMYYYCVVTNTDNTLSGTTTASTTSKIFNVTAKP
jgi:hypothetical protein